MFYIQSFSCLELTNQNVLDLKSNLFFTKILGKNKSQVIACGGRDIKTIKRS